MKSEMKLVTTEYHRQLVELHKQRQWGASGYSHADIVYKYCKQLGAKTILDFGCGRATLKPALLKLDSSIDVREYDPAIEGKDAFPEPADLLVANDVLEHIEYEKLDEELYFIRSLAIKGAYFTIALDLSKVSLPDGRNAHLIIQPREWWLAKLREYGFAIKKEIIKKGLWVWAK